MALLKLRTLAVGAALFVETCDAPAMLGRKLALLKMLSSRKLLRWCGFYTCGATLPSAKKKALASEYLGLEDGPPIFRQDLTCPVLLVFTNAFYLYGAITHYG